ncbi:MAG: DUF5652 family protein [Dehalococcoidales bacterium]
MPINGFSEFLPFLPLLWLIIPLVVVWSMAWKGIALWRAGRNGHLVWFIVLFIVNTMGILPIIYIFAFSRKGNKISVPQGNEQ